MAGSRVFVQEGIYFEFLKKLEEKVRSRVVGDPFDVDSQQGPQVWPWNFKYFITYMYLTTAFS